MNEHPAVKIWRDTFKLNLKLGFKQDIILTVTNLEAWRSLLSEWKAKKWNPLNIKEQLSEYERRANKHNAASGKSGERSPASENRDTGLPARGNGNLREVRTDTRVQPGRSDPSLEDIVTNALRYQNRA